MIRHASQHTRTQIARYFFVALALSGALCLTQVFLRPATAATTQRSGGGRAHQSPLVGRAQSITGDTFRTLVSTPRGVQVYAVTSPRAEVLHAIDRGLTELFNVARRAGYRARLNHSDYTVFLARPDRTRNRDGQYSPDIALGAAQYAGSVYDQGGYVYAAGMVLANEPCAFIIAEHERDFARVSNVARYEGEHLVLFHNDRALYMQTRDHSRGGSHPILQ